MFVQTSTSEISIVHTAESSSDWVGFADDDALAFCFYK